MTTTRRGVLAAGVAAGVLATVLTNRRVLRAGRATTENGAESGTVAVSGYGSDGVALQRAIDTGAREVVVDRDVTVAADVMLRAGQQLRFAGGRIVVAADATIINAVLCGRDGSGIVLLDPSIDAKACRDAVTGIRLLDTAGARIAGGRLLRANLRLESHNTARDLAIDVSGLAIDMDGSAATAIYLSGVRGVSMRDVECLGGIEGVGIYNNARRLAFDRVRSHGHRRDGFVVIAGQEVVHTGCEAHDNGQSGFATQRQTAGTDSRTISWVRCRSWDNVYDGFDLRGATDRPWHVDTGFVLSGCSARANRECGFYVVKAEGTVLQDCTGTRNRRQNLFIDTSDRVAASGFRSVSGAAAVEAGPNKAGILVYDSAGVDLDGPVSGNGDGRTQDYGIAFTGTSRGARLQGGDLSGNVAGPTFAAPGAVSTR